MKKIRLQVDTEEGYEQILFNYGFKRINHDANRQIWGREGELYRVAWLHRNSWGFLSYIDLIKIKNN